MSYDNLSTLNPWAHIYLSESARDSWEPGQTWKQLNDLNQLKSEGN